MQLLTFMEALHQIGLIGKARHSRSQLHRLNCCFPAQTTFCRDHCCASTGTFEHLACERQTRLLRNYRFYCALADSRPRVLRQKRIVCGRFRMCEITADVSIGPSHFQLPGRASQSGKISLGTLTPYFIALKKYNIFR